MAPVAMADEADLLSFDLDLGSLSLRVHTAPLAPPGFGTGVGLWNGGEQLARFVASLPRTFARSTTALELGCGASAAPARALAARGGTAVATDRGAGLLALTARNVQEDAHGRVHVAPLAWGDPGALAAALAGLARPPTLVLAADVAYDEDAWPALLATMAGAATAGGPATRPAPVLVALPARPESAGFLPAAASAGWCHRTLRAVPPADPSSVRTDIVQLWLGGPATTARPTSLVIADFDWSCVEGNTDTLAASALGALAEAALAAATDAGRGWTAAMGAALACGPAGVAERGAAGVGMAAEVRGALAQAGAGRGGGAGAAATTTAGQGARVAAATTAALIIVSDANSRLIEAALAAHGLSGAPALIVTNPAGVGAAGEMTLAAFHGGGPPSPPSSEDGEERAKLSCPAWHPPRRAAHACRACPANLCKGAVVEALLASARVPPGRVLYIGDGANDACPCVRLVEGGAPGDLVLARSHYPDGRAAPLAGALQGKTGVSGGGARVVEWREAGEAGRAMKAWLDSGE